MKKNSLRMVALLALAIAGCDEARADAPEPFQGVVELDEVSLGFDVPGRVLRVDVKEGDVLAQGGAVASLDDALVTMARDVRKADVSLAQAQLKLLQAGARPQEVRGTQAELESVRTQEKLLQEIVKRQQGLVAAGAVAEATLDDLAMQTARFEGQRRSLGEKLAAQKSGARPEELEAARARVAAAETGLAAEQEKLARHTLSSPRAGTVLDVLIEPGEVVGAGTPVVTLADTSHPFVDVFVPQARIGNLAEGATAKLRIDGNERTFVGRVEHIGRKLEFTPRFLFSEKERPNLVLRVRVRMDAGDVRVPAGVPAFVSIEAL